MTVTKTLAERGSRYGAFADHARIAQGLQDVMRAHPNWNNLDPDMKQALSVIADKIARILNGDPFYLDNWHDIQGYAKLIEDRLNMIPTADDALFDTIADIPAYETLHPLPDNGVYLSSAANPTILSDGGYRNRP